MKDWGKIEVKIKGTLGVAKPFRQGSSWKMTIPKGVVKEHNLELKTKKEYFSYIFVDTDKGLLLLPLDKVVNPKNLRDALKFVDVSHLSDEDLKFLFEEQT